MGKSKSERITVTAVVVMAIVGIFASSNNTDSRVTAAMKDERPQVFAEGVVSKGHEFAITFTPDMRQAYFTRGFPDKKTSHILRTELKEGRWQEPTLISFSSEQWSDLDPTLSPNGRRLFFISTRPAPATQDLTIRNMDIWYADLVGNDWGHPQYLENVNSLGKEGSPTVSKDGTLCFFSDRGRESNANSIYCAEFEGGHYSEPKRLGREINSEASDTSPFLSADGKTLLFYSTRTGGYGKADLYVSSKRHKRWMLIKNLGPIVNTEEFEYNPVLSPDGKKLYFGRKGNIYWIPVQSLTVLSKKARENQ